MTYFGVVDCGSWLAQLSACSHTYTIPVMSEWLRVLITQYPVNSEGRPLLQEWDHTLPMCADSISLRSPVQPH